MMQFRFSVGATAAVLIMLGTSGIPGDLAGQDFPLAPQRPNDQPISPFMEGWYENDDGSYTISFGYLNRNEDRVVRLPVGPDNEIDPEEFSGMQPTVFEPGRHRGVFAITLPPERSDEDVWWSITNRTRETPNGEVHKVPGRTRASAYELDYNARPQGSRHPVVWFEEDGVEGRAVRGVFAENVESATVGTPVTLEVSARDPSERDPEDPRFREPVSLRVSWSLHQGPGDVEFERHETTYVEPEEEEDEGGFQLPSPGPEVIMLPEGSGTARVYATFSEPGEYMLRAEVDNFNAPDSSSGDQCCWSNAYVRVNVSP